MSPQSPHLMRKSTLTLALAAVTTPVLAQDLAPEVTSTTLETPASSTLEVLAATDAWRAEHGAEWIARLDKETGQVRFLFGGHTEPLFEPKTDEDFALLGRHWISEAYDQLGIDAGPLELDSVDFLPLGLIGSTDKTSVQFQQQVDGVDVERGLVNALFDQEGRLLSLDTVGLPDHRLPASGEPTRDAAPAERLARATFLAETGQNPVDVDVLGLIVAQEETDSIRKGTLSWQIRVGNEVDGEPAAFRYAISATGELRVVRADTQIHYFDVGGNVQAMSTPGLSAPQPANPPAAFPMGYMRVTSPQAGVTFTDANGDFNFPGVTGPIQATFEFVGTFNNVNNEAGADYALTTTLADGTGNSVLMNPTSNELITAQANCMLHINLMRDWTKNINPADNSSDFVANANANLSQTCNAYYNGISTNYYQAGGGCNNTAFSSVVYHEMGHWMNDVYSSGNGGDGFGEGNADVFAMYQTDSPIIGDDFCGTGCFIRNGENTRQFCGDANPGCYGQVHTDGEVLMGALWKVRKRLNTTHGDLAGDAISSLLFNTWMNAYNDGQIKTIIEEHWLTLDDDNGNIGDGTPNYADIDGGFRDQGFPGFDLLFININNVVGPVDTLDENGPYGVSAELTTNFGTTITTANLIYRVNGGFPASVAMAAASGDRWHATIPGNIASPNKVEWYVSVADDGGNTLNFPKEAPTVWNDFTVGDVQVFFFDDFESAGDNGWTHAQVAEQDDWQHDVQNGKAGDPSSAYSGTRLWGNDLGPDGWNGEYKPNVENYLRSPFIDLTGATGSKLVYQRWLTVEEAIYDQAQINVNGTNVWQNPLNGNLIDTSWDVHEVDLSSFDGQNVQLEWRLITDGGLEFGGWNLDDVSIQTVAASPTVGVPTTYGAGTAGTSGTPSIDSLGQPATLGNAEFRVAVKDAAAEATAFLALGFSQVTIPTLGVTGLTLPSSIVTGSTDLHGQFDAPFPIPGDASFVGLSGFFQALVIDAGGPQGFSATPGLTVTIVP